MALLQRTRILPNERLDLPDFNNLENFVCADFKAIHKHVWSNENFVFSGFESTGSGTTTLSIALANSALIIGEDDGVLYIGAPSLDPLATDALTPNATNFVELSIDFNTGGADSRAFWDPTAGGGQGGEFSQIVDTFTFLEATLNLNTSSFSGSADKVPICEVDVNASGIITEIRDGRNTFFSLRRRGDLGHTFPWASRTEPTNVQFNGADKDINTLKEWMDAMMDGLREIKGTTYWYESPPVAFPLSFQNSGLSTLVSISGSARFGWTGTELSITDDNGGPTSTDVLASLRIFDSAIDLDFTRQDGAGGSATIPLGDGEVLWIELPDPLANTTYDSVGLTSTNYRLNSRGSVPLAGTTYWLAYREGTRLYLRGLGELEAGEERQVNDESSLDTIAFIGATDETDSTPPYTCTPSVLLPATFTTNNSLTEAISANCENIDYVAGILDNNAYDEALVLVAAAPSGNNEILGPITSGTTFSIPLDSRDSLNSEPYEVGKGLLEVYLNGQYLCLGVDWNEVGAPASLSTQIEILQNLVVGDKLQFRIDTAGGFGAGGGGASTLQDSYNLGSTILVASGNPITINGPVAEKLLVINGDIDVTGVIDPAGLTFSQQISTPLGVADFGLWRDSNDDLIFQVPGGTDVNITAAASGAASSVAISNVFINNTGGTIVLGTPVCINTTTGELEVLVVTEIGQNIENFIGIAAENINDGTSGAVLQSGRIENIPTILNYGAIWASVSGGLSNDAPSDGVNGFVAGDYAVKLGILVKNNDNPANKDLIVNFEIRAQL